jgi:hypothetical protein
MVDSVEDRLLRALRVIFQKGVKSLGLRDVARETVQEETSLTGGRRNVLLDQTQHQLVRDQLKKKEKERKTNTREGQG